MTTSRLAPPFGALLALAASTALAQAPPPLKPTPAMLAPPAARTAEGFASDGLRAVFYEGVPWKGKPTEVFAWIGLPEHPPGEKVPGIVLVHGGGGTAFDSWVKLWTSRGYAAIAMDTCGTVPRGSYGKWERHERGGPPGPDFADGLAPAEDQWPYHAAADVLLAHSLLRSLPEVDPGRIGLTGISWGGFLTCLVAGLDDRFRFAAPVYGCGFLGENSCWTTELADRGEAGRRWLALWDPSHYLPAARMPMLWVTGTNDFAFPLDSLQKSYRIAGGPSTLAVRLRMPHGHGPAGEGPDEIRAFADSILRGGPALPRVGPLERRDGRAEATYRSDVPIARAELLYTRDAGQWTDRPWEVAEARVAPGSVSATLPPGVRAYFLNLYDEGGRVTSADHGEIP